MGTAQEKEAQAGAEINTSGTTDSPPFQVGDKVKTSFYEKDKDLIRTVEAVYRMRSQTGWYVATRDQHGRGLACDSAWYELA